MRALLRLRQGPVLALHRLRQDQVQDRHLHRAEARPRALDPPSEPIPTQFFVVGLHGELIAGAKTPLVILSGAVGFVLLIACVNVGGLLLARGIRREREIWVRMALGASRSRVVRQLVTESMLLTLVGGFAGVWLAVSGVRWFRMFGAAMPRQDLGTSSIVPRLHEVGIDGTVLLFALGVSVVAGLACGLAPALWQSRVEARGELARETSLSAPGFNLFRRSRGRALLVVVQIGLAVVLLLGSGLLIRSFLKLSSVNPGYATTRVLTFQVPLSPNQSALRFSADLIARIKGLPACGPPGTLTTCRSLAAISGTCASVRVRRRASPWPASTASSAGYQRKTGLPGRAPRQPGLPGRVGHRRCRGPRLLRRGSRRPSAQPPHQPNAGAEWIARRAPGRNTCLHRRRPLGHHGYCRGCPRDRPGRPSRPEIFASLERSSTDDTLLVTPRLYFAVRTEIPPASLIPSIRRIVNDLDPQTAPDRIATMEEILSIRFSSRASTPECSGCLR